MANAQQPTAPFPWTLNADQTLVTIGPIEKPAVLNGATVEVTAQWFGYIRSLLRPPVPTDPMLAASLPVLAHFVVAARTPDPPVETGCQILVRSEHFGWFVLPLNADGCTDLVRKLVEKPPR